MVTEKMIEAICRSPTIEVITPTTEQWDRCETIQDRYDLMKRLVNSALSAQVQDVAENDLDIGEEAIAYFNEFEKRSSGQLHDHDIMCAFEAGRASILGKSHE